MAYPLTNVQVTVDDVALSDSAILPLLSGCVSECTSRALLRSECELYEPLMNIEVVYKTGSSFDMPHEVLIFSDIAPRGIPWDHSK